MQHEHQRKGPLDCKTVLVLSSNIELGGVAEGIETETLFAAVQALGGNWFQEFLFSQTEPLPQLEMVAA